MNKELHLLDLIKSNGNVNQRHLAEELDVSLGTVNKRLQHYEEINIIESVRKSSRKIEYILTESGHIMHNQLLTEHIGLCFEIIAHLKKSIKQQLYQLVSEEITYFFVQGDMDDIGRVVKMCLLEVSRKEKITFTLFCDSDEGKQCIHHMSEEKQKKSIVLGWTVSPEDAYDPITYKNILS